VGFILGGAEGQDEGLQVDCADGLNVGSHVGATVGRGIVGIAEGFDVEHAVENADGALEGFDDGLVVGVKEGKSDGIRVGFTDGMNDGGLEGLMDG